MSSRQPVETADLDIYGAGEMPWSRAEEALHKGSVDPATPWFLGTVRPDGRPHSAGIGVALLDGELYFTSGAGARKARNTRGQPGVHALRARRRHRPRARGSRRAGHRPAVLEAVAAVYRDGGWPAEVEGDALTAPYSAQSAGPPPWQLYRFTLVTAFGVGLREPFGASRWRF